MARTIPPHLPHLICMSSAIGASAGSGWTDRGFASRARCPSGVGQDGVLVQDELPGRVTRTRHLSARHPRGNTDWEAFRSAITCVPPDGGPDITLQTLIDQGVWPPNTSGVPLVLADRDHVVHQAGQHVAHQTEGAE